MTGKQDDNDFLFGDVMPEGIEVHIGVDWEFGEHIHIGAEIIDGNRQSVFSGGGPATTSSQFTLIEMILRRATDEDLTKEDRLEFLNDMQHALSNTSALVQIAIAKTKAGGKIQ